MPLILVTKHLDEQATDLRHHLCFAGVFLAHGIGLQVAQPGELVLQYFLGKTAFESFRCLELVIAIPGCKWIAPSAQNRHRLVILLPVHMDPELFRFPRILHSCKELRFIGFSFGDRAEFPEGLVFFARQVIDGLGKL